MQNIRKMIQKHSDHVPSSFKLPDVGSLIEEPNEDDIEVAISAFQKWGFGNQKSKAGGAYGSYLQLTAKMGAKVLRAHCYDSVEDATARGQTVWEEAQREAKNLMSARKIYGDLVPKFCHLGVVKWQEKYYIAMMVQHIDGKMLHDLGYNHKWSDTCSDLMVECREILESKDYDFKDLHTGNVMLIRQDGVNHLRVVDWGIEDTLKLTKLAGIHTAKSRGDLIAYLMDPDEEIRALAKRHTERFRK